MPILVKLALFGWIPLVLLLFRHLPHHRALLVGVIGGVLFLPEVQMAKVSEEAPDASEFVLIFLKLTKPNAISAAGLLAALLFDRRRLSSFRPRWFDVPMAVWCVVPFFSDLGIGISPYASFAAARDQTLSWGVPYLLGRVYFTDFRSFRDLAIGLVLGGLVYLPFALYEIRFSPQLHERLYGFFPGSKNEFDRMGGFRPIVFMSHGLAVGMWLVATAVVAFWLWWSGAVRSIRVWRLKKQVPMTYPALALLGVSVLARSTGAIGIGLAGVLALLQVRWLKMPILVIALLAVSPLYLVARTSGWDAKQFTDWVMVNVDVDRANSFIYRVRNEGRLVRKVWGSPAFGYGDTGEARKVEKEKKGDEPEAVTDSLWIICLSCYGFVGLVAFWAAMLVPAARFLWTYPARTWSHPAVAPAAAVAVVVIIYMLDNLSNAMQNSALILSAGALAGVTGARAAAQDSEAAKPQAATPADQGSPTPYRPGVLIRNRLRR